MTRYFTVVKLAAAFALLLPRPRAEELAHLLRFGDLHLALVALVNDDLYERMRRVRGMTEKVAERNRLQLRRGVAAYQRRIKSQESP